MHFDRKADTVVEYLTLVFSTVNGFIYLFIYHFTVNFCLYTLHFIGPWKLILLNVSSFNRVVTVNVSIRGAQFRLDQRNTFSVEIVLVCAFEF